MRPAKLAVLLPIAALVAIVAPATAAQAKTAATAQATTTYTCYPNTPAAFNVSNSDVVNKQVTTTLADGTPIPGGFVAQSDPPYYPSMTSGPLVESFTNETTGKTIVRNVSGPNWFTYDPTPQRARCAGDRHVRYDRNHLPAIRADERGSPPGGRHP